MAPWAANEVPDLLVVGPRLLPLGVPAKAFLVVVAARARERGDGYNPPELPMPTRPALVAQEVGLDAVGHCLEHVVAAAGAGQLTLEQVGLWCHGGSCVS